MNEYGAAIVRTFTTLLLVALLGVGVSWLMYAVNKWENPDYTKMVWGTIESTGQYQQEVGTNAIYRQYATVLFEVIDGDYTGTYRSKIKDNGNMVVGDQVLLMASSNYKFVGSYDEYKFKGTEDTTKSKEEANETIEPETGLVIESVETFANSVGNAVIFIIKVMVGIAICGGAIAIFMFAKKRIIARQHIGLQLENCSNLTYADIRRLLEPIDIIRNLIKVCPNKAYRNVLKNILQQMYKQLNYVVDMNNVSAGTSKDAIAIVVCNTVFTFNELSERATKQVYSITTKEAKSVFVEMQRAIEQLKAYDKLEEKYTA